LTQIAWWHNVVIVSKCQSTEEATYYVHHTLHHGWSRSVLTHQIESKLWQREGRAINNFSQTLPAPRSDLADKMRGHMDPSEYKHVVLGLIFLKYISDAFEEKMMRLTSELSEKFVESRRLEDEIRKNLEGLGFDV